MKRRALILAGLAVAAAAVVIPTVAQGGGKPNPTFQVLAQPLGPEDELTLPEQGKLQQLAADPHAARYAGELAGHTVYVAPGVGATVCFLDSSADGVGGACIARDSLKNEATYAGFSTTDGDVGVIVPVPDAYDKVNVRGRWQKVSDNVALTRVPRNERSTLEIVGDDVEPLVGAIDTAEE
jgi:hypothetical protein